MTEENQEQVLPKHKKEGQWQRKTKKEHFPATKQESRQNIAIDIISFVLSPWLIRYDTIEEFNVDSKAECTA